MVLHGFPRVFHHFPNVFTSPIGSHAARCMHRACVARGEAFSLFDTERSGAIDARELKVQDSTLWNGWNIPQRYWLSNAVKTIINYPFGNGKHTTYFSNYQLIINIQ